MLGGAEALDLDPERRVAGGQAVNALGLRVLQRLDLGAQVAHLGIQPVGPAALARQRLP